MSAASETMKILFVNDTENHYHWGCTGTSLALKEKIQDLGFEIIPVSIKSTKTWTTWGTNTPRTVEEFKDEQVFTDFCNRNPELITQLKSADALVINGEGTIHGGLRANPLNLLYFAYIARRFFLKHVEIINHSVYPEDFSSTQSRPDFSIPQSDSDKKTVQDLYKMVYETLDYVAIREPISLAIAENWNLTRRPTLSFDCMPLYIRDHYTRKKASSNTIVIAGSVAWEEAAMPALGQYIRQQLEQGYVVKILIGAKADPAQDDANFVECLERTLGDTWQKVSVIDAQSLDEWLETIENAALLVSGRFHYSIAAACLETPFVALNSNTLKIHGLMNILEMPEPLIYENPENLYQQLIERTETALGTTPKNYTQTLCELAENNFSGLKALHAVESDPPTVLFALWLARGQDPQLRAIGETGASTTVGSPGSTVGSPGSSPRGHS